MDRDFDGQLSFAEMMGEETAVETLFKKMDLNGDGFVTKKVNYAFFFLEFLVWSFLVYISYIVNSAQAICSVHTPHVYRKHCPFLFLSFFISILPANNVIF